MAAILPAAENAFTPGRSGNGELCNLPWQVACGTIWPAPPRLRRRHGEWARDGECDDPRFEGEGSAETTVERRCIERRPQFRAGGYLSAFLDEAIAQGLADDDKTTRSRRSSSASICTSAIAPTSRARAPSTSSAPR